MATTDTVIPSAASLPACPSSPASEPVDVNPSVNKMMCFNADFAVRSFSPASSSGVDRSVFPDGTSPSRPLRMTASAGSFWRSMIHLCSVLKASTPT